MSRKILRVLSLIFILNIIFFSGKLYALTSQDNLKYEGIDVSRYQGIIDFSKVKDAGIGIVYIKASQGANYVDSNFELNYNNARANNLKVGFYHYLTATNVNEARAQADFFASIIQGKMVDCKLAMDYEQFYGVQKNQVNQIAVAFINRLKSLTGKDVIIYSNLDNVKNTFNNTVASTGKLWLAYYGNTQNIINTSSSWNTYIGIQYTNKGRVSGINGDVDKDRFSTDILLDSTEIPEDNSNNNEKENIINYIVKKGDTLSKIAQEFNTTVNDIAKLNNIQNVNLIYPCQILKIYEKTFNNESSGSNIISYKIKYGDTLSQIAKRYNVTVQSIVDLNNIQNPNYIYVGNVIKIEVNSNANNGIIYTVKRGDTLSEIALKYGTTVNKISEQNNITNVNKIYVGQTLKIY